MKKLIISVMAVAALTGCAPKANGICATSVEGTCVGRWMDGEVVAVGGVDQRYTGLVMDADGSIHGTVSTKTVSWE